MATKTIQEKARHFLAAKAEGDERCFIVLMMLTVKTGLHPDESMRRIEQLAMETH